MKITLQNTCLVLIVVLLAIIAFRPFERKVLSYSLDPERSDGARNVPVGRVPLFVRYRAR